MTDALPARRLSAFMQLSLDGFYCDSRGDMEFARKPPEDVEWQAFVGVRLQCCPGVGQAFVVDVAGCTHAAILDPFDGTGAARQEPLCLAASSGSAALQPSQQRFAGRRQSLVGQRGVAHRRQ